MQAALTRFAAPLTQRSKLDDLHVRLVCAADQGVVVTTARPIRRREFALAALPVRQGARVWRRRANIEADCVTVAVFVHHQRGRPSVGGKLNLRPWLFTVCADLELKPALGETMIEHA